VCAAPPSVLLVVIGILPLLVVVLLGAIKVLRLGDVQERVHQALALDLDAPGALPPLPREQRRERVRDVDAARLAVALHARRGVHRVAKQRELGHLGAHQAGDQGAGVDADAEKDGGLVVRHEHLRASEGMHMPV
jgi:hypothetical protein